MLNFKELPQDGVNFELLIREIFVREEYETYWTGFGPDGGRDLIVIENLEGRISKYQRRWIVSCKHFANNGNNGRSVGLADLGNFISDCQSINAEGFILACSTYPSSSVVKRLDEVSQNKNIITKIWDCVEIENKLNTPKTFGLIHTFFPISSQSYQWKIYNEFSPSFWSAGFKSYFLYLSSRDANTYPNLKGIETLINLVERVEKIIQKSKEIYIRPRSIYYDDKHCVHTVYLDYLFDRSVEKKDLIETDKIRDLFLKDFTDNDHKFVNFPDIDIRYVKASFASDHFHKDHKDYYEKFLPYFKSGKPRGNMYYDYNF